MANTETWYWNETLNISSLIMEIIDFEAGGMTFKAITVRPTNKQVVYDSTAGEGMEYDPYSYGQWVDSNFRTITFSQSPTGALLNFLNANAVKLGSPGISKVEYSGETLINLTADTITANTLLEGVTAHDSSGALIIGTANIPEREQRMLDLDMASGNQIITPDTSIALMDKVTIVKPSTMIPENIKKDVNIGGVVGTMESGGGAQSETWVWDEGFYFLSGLLLDPITIDFKSNGTEYHSIRAGTDAQHWYLYYDDTEAGQGTKDGGMFFDNGYEPYRKMIFSKPITETSCEKLYYQFTEGGYDGESTATKQPPDVALQPSKSVEITANGTTTVTPDVPYDGLQSVEVVANVASEPEGWTVTCNEGIEAIRGYIKPNGEFVDCLKSEVSSALVAPNSIIITIYNIIDDRSTNISSMYESVEITVSRDDFIKGCKIYRVIGSPATLTIEHSSGGTDQ